jgi:hypothetical protein
MLKVLQVNLNRCRAAHDVLEQTVQERGIGLCLLSEPNEQITRRKRTWVKDDDCDTAIWWTGLDRETAIRNRGAGEGFSWLDVEGVAVIYSCYFSPNRELPEFEAYLESLGNSIRGHGPGKRLVITGDFNAAHPSWGGRRGNGINRDRGEPLLDWMAEQGLSSVNDGRSPTFVGPRGSSFVDLTMVCDGAAPLLRGWRVGGEETMSDHRYLWFELASDLSPLPAPPGRRWEMRHLSRTVLTEVVDAGCERLTVGDVDEQSLATVLTQACEAADSRSPPSRHPGAAKHRPKYWWTEEIALARRECIRLRRVMTRAGGWLGRESRRLGRPPEEGEGQIAALRADYRSAQTSLRKLINASKARAWKELLETVEQDVWGLPYRIVMDRLRPRPPKIPPEVLVETVNHLFPTQPARDEERFEVPPEDIPEVSLEEVERAAKRLASGKAPGPDGIPPAVAKLLVRRWPNLFQSLANKLLAEGRFPDLWKRANLVLVPKPGAAPGPSAYRPICLLDTMGKILENVLVERLNAEIEAKGAMSEAQYGFRKGRSTFGALNRVLKRAGEESMKTQNTRGFVLLVLLDVRNAFNTMNWGVLMEALRRKGISGYLRRIISSYLDERSLSTGETTHRVTAGVPQGSILGPVLWNLAYDGVLEVALPEGAELVAYADDLALMVTHTDEVVVEERANEALARIEEWMARNHLQLAPQKTEAMFLTGKKWIRRGVNLVLAGHPVAISKKAKYLGVILDKGLTGNEHIKYVCAKVQKVSLNLARIIPRAGGVSEAGRRLLASVGESMALYAAPVWGNRALQGVVNRRCLRSAQRGLAIRVSRAYRTVSTEALLVLAKMLPWDLLASERSMRFLMGGEVNLSEARAATISAWQEEWSRELRPGEVAKGSWTKALIPDIRVWLDSAGDMSYYVAQVLSGHGQFQSFMLRIGKISSDTCVLCDSGETDDVTHTVLCCPALREARALDRPTLEDESIPGIVSYMMTGASAWSGAVRWLDAIMGMKTELERQRRERFERPAEAGREGAQGEGTGREGEEEGLGGVATTAPEGEDGSRRTPPVGAGTRGGTERPARAGEMEV